ncbi:Retrovirus-related Pol polyprotein from transposon opus, partial [Mucuna pruriens]
MRSPISVKEVQQLAERITVLSPEKSAPIFQRLRKAERFKWVDNCEELKAMLATPPILTQSVVGKPIYVYISIFDNVVSLVIIQEGEGEQRPIYYISKALQGAEQRYQKIEKVTLTIIVASKKLRPYFQSHPMVCRTNLPIWQILQKLDLVGRMTRWVVELSEFDIAYERKGHMKAQVLDDFNNELTPNSDDEEVLGRTRSGQGQRNESYPRRTRWDINRAIPPFQFSSKQQLDKVGKGVGGGKVDGKERLPASHRIGQCRLSGKGPPADSIFGCSQGIGQDFGKIHPTTYPSRAK